MNARPDYANLETGEIVDVLPDGSRSPLQIAKSELAAFKFKLIETVAADPKLRKAPCANAIVVFMSFVSIDEQTLKPTHAYASLTTLMAKGGMKRSAANMARRLLVQERYLVPAGCKTKDGCLKYQLENLHFERVQMHVREAMEYWQAIAAEQRADERRKRTAPDRVSEYDTTGDACGVSGQHDRVSEYDTNYLIGNLGGLGSREEAQTLKVSTTPSYLPFPVPESETEARLLILSLLDGRRPSPAQLWFVQTKLMAGELTMKHIDDLEDAA